MGGDLSMIMEIQKYVRAIHIMAMLILGFGFLMVFVKKYGRTTLTATFMLVSVALPIYFLKENLGILSAGDSIIDKLILAEFAAASLLICAGAVLGRVKLWQYMLLGVLFVPFYAFNEWILLEGGLGLVHHGAFVDVGGSIVIHAFGALFGTAVALSMTTKKEFAAPIEVDSTSERFSLLGSMILWVFWPSFCAALVPTKDIPATIINVILALCGSTIATYLTSMKMRGKVNVADVANAALAGGVAIGSTCDKVSPGIAFLIGILAGALSVFGFAAIQERLQKLLKMVDTCGVLYLHGLPGLFGGLAAMVFVKGISMGDQILGILITVIVALVAGFIVGKLLSLTGRREAPYLDAEELDLE